MKRCCFIVAILICLRSESQQLIQATLKSGASPDEVEVWLRPNFNNSTQYIAQIVIPIAWPSSATPQPTSLNVTIDPGFTAAYGQYGPVVVSPEAQSTNGTEKYREIILARNGTGASNPQTWTANTEIKLLSIKFNPCNAPGTLVKIVSYDDGGSDGQAFFYAASGNADYYVTLNAAGNYYSTSGQSIAGGNSSNGYVQSVAAIPPACSAPFATVSGVTTTSAEFNWTAIPGSNSYEYSITTSVSDPTSGTSISGTNYVATGLGAGTNYYFHIRSVCGCGFSSWATVPFTTLSASCDPPTSISINIIGVNSVDFSWPVVAGASGYEYVVSTSSTAPASGATTTGTSANNAGLVAGTTYNIYVRSNCGAGIFSGWTSTSFTTLPPPCLAPSINVSNVTATSAQLDWSAVAGSNGYEYVVTTSAIAPASGTPIIATSYPAPNLASGSTYYVYVRNNCGGGIYSTWSNVSFTTLCPQPTGLNVSNINSTDANIVWANTSSTGYEIAITNSPSLPTSGILVSTNSYPATGLSAGATYYVFVRSVCAASNYSQWTSTQFTTACPPVTITVGSLNPTSAAINWTNIADADGYEVIVTMSNIPPASGASTIFNSILQPGLTPGTQYWAYVRTRCGPGVYSTWSFQQFTTPFPPCNSPLSFTATTNEDVANLTWSAVNGAVGYEYAIATSNTPPASGMFTTATSAPVPNLLSNTNYFVFVRAVCGPGRTSGWVNQSFGIACLKPKLFLISNDRTTGTAELGWFKVEAALQYEYAITNYAVPPAGTTASTKDTTLHAADLKPGYKYYLHVRTRCKGNSVSKWSTIEFYTTGLSVNPNPFTNTIHVTVYGAADQNGEVAVFDAVGKLLKVERLNGSAIDINMDGYAAGVYILRYGKDKRFSKKVVKL